MAINWGLYSGGAQIVPIVLVHGAPWVFVPEGVTVTSVSWGTSPDALFWPDDTAKFTTNARAWLSLKDGLSWTERLQPTQPAMLDVGAITVTLSDVGQAATALFSSEDNIVTTFLTAEVSTTATTVNVVSTAAFPSSGVFYLGREAIAYGGKTGTSFTSCTRAQYSSTAVRHSYATSQGTGLGNPEARDAVGNPVGYPASVWFGRIVAGVLVEVELQFLGNVGVGAALSDGDGWVLHLDHAVRKLSQPLRQRPVLVSGYAHLGNAGTRTSTRPGAGAQFPDYTNPATFLFGTSSGATAFITLTDDANATDQSGWHPTKETFVNALDAAGRAAVTAVNPANTFSATLGATGLLTMSATFTTSQALETILPWCEPIESGTGLLGGVTSFETTYTTSMPDAWVPLVINGRVYLNDSDYASVPSVPVLDAGAAATNTSALYAFAFDRQGDTPIYCAISALTTSGGVNYATIIPLQSSSLTPTPGTSARTTTNIRRLTFGPRGFGGVIETPTNARLSLLVRSDSWVAALRYAVIAVNDALGDSASEVFDWNDIESTVSLHASPAGAAREYIIDLKDSVLSVAVNEAALNGYALALKQGRITFVRVAEFATTEVTDDTVTTAMLRADAPLPQYDLATDGITNTFELTLPDKSKVTYVDQTSRTRYGQGRTPIRATYPVGWYLTDSAAQLYMRAATVAMQSLGPHRYPYRNVTVALGLNKVGIQTGALLTVSLWRVPNTDGTRGVTNVIGQVMARTPTFYGDQPSGVRLVIRLNPSFVAGYAPSGLVAASGISGTDVTFDTASAFGGSCFAITGREPTDGFTVGDKVRLVEIDSTSPTSSTQHTVTAITASTLTLNPAPNAALAAQQYKVMVVYDDWDVVVTPQKAGWCYLAESDNTLDGDNGRRYAA